MSKVYFRVILWLGLSLMAKSVMLEQSSDGKLKMKIVLVESKPDGGEDVLMAEIDEVQSVEFIKNL